MHSADELVKMADEAIHAYAAWLAEFTTGDLPSLHADRLNDEKDAARRRLEMAIRVTVAGVQGTRKAIACIGCGSMFDAYAFGTDFPACCPSCGEAGSEPLNVAGRSGSWWHDRSKTRDVAGILRLLTPRQMAEEIVRLDAVIAGQPDVQMGRLPPGVKTVDGEQQP
jgi:hypothetical protein